MRAARPLLGEKPASGAVRVEVDGDNDSLKTYFMPAGGTTSAMGHLQPPYSFAAGDSLSPDSFRAGRMPPTIKEGHFRNTRYRATRAVRDDGRHGATMKE